MICQPCRVPGHQVAACEDSQREEAVYRSCCCQHRKIIPPVNGDQDVAEEDEVAVR